MNNTEINTAGVAPTAPPQQVLMQISQGMWLAQTVATAARLGIADALAQSQPQDATTLARAVGADARALARLLRALASVGVLAEPLPQQYTLTPAGELLRSDVSDSMRDWLIAETDTPHWQASYMRVCALARPLSHNYSECTFMNTTPRIPRIAPVSVARWATFRRWLPRALYSITIFRALDISSM